MRSKTNGTSRASHRPLHSRGHRTGGSASSIRRRKERACTADTQTDPALLAVRTREQETGVSTSSTRKNKERRTSESKVAEITEQIDVDDGVPVASSRSKHRAASIRSKHRRTSESNVAEITDQMDVDDGVPAASSRSKHRAASIRGKHRPAGAAPRSVKPHRRNFTLKSRRHRAKLTPVSRPLPIPPDPDECGAVVCLDSDEETTKSRKLRRSCGNGDSRRSRPPDRLLEQPPDGSAQQRMYSLRTGSQAEEALISSW